LKNLQAELAKKGKTEKAEAVRERLLLVESIAADHLLGKTPVADVLKKAATGKYKHLLHVLLVAADRANYNDFSDYGHYTGNSWAGFNDLSPGYWVYVFPRWYIWRDGPKP